MLLCWFPDADTRFLIESIIPNGAGAHVGKKYNDKHFRTAPPDMIVKCGVDYTSRPELDCTIHYMVGAKMPSTVERQ